MVAGYEDDRSPKSVEEKGISVKEMIAGLKKVRG
jgi:hypothetical protein